MNSYQLPLSLLFSLFLLISCTDNDTPRPDNNIVYPGNVIGNGEQSFEIRDQQTLKRGTYLLKGWCYVTDGATLIIEPGTVIKGDKETRAALIVEPGGRIVARGTADAPIVFTSSMPAGERRPGDWGGVVLCGNARNNMGVQQIEGGPRTLHGGTDDVDNSGILSYVRIEFAGYPFKKNQEINGLTLGSVGSGTELNHIQVSYANDDAFEWFGGTVNADYLVAYHCWDDDFDVDNGFRGTCRQLLGVRHPRIADVTGSHAFECSNNGTDTPGTPTTSARFEQVTIFGPADADEEFVNSSEYINGGTLKPDNGSMLGLFGAALQLDANTQVSFSDITVSGYPEEVNGTPTQLDNAVFTSRRTPVYPQWTTGWCNFNPQQTAY